MAEKYFNGCRRRVCLSEKWCREKILRFIYHIVVFMGPILKDQITQSKTEFTDGWMHTRVRGIFPILKVY